MTYDLRRDIDRQRFASRVAQLTDKGAVVDLTEKMQRTRGQNSYLHALLGVLALDTGNTLDYCKEVYFKRLANKDLFVTVRRDQYAGEVEILRSSTDLTKEEMSLAIDRFKRWATDQGFYMPDPFDEDRLREIEIEMQRQQRFL